MQNYMVRFGRRLKKQDILNRDMPQRISDLHGIYAGDILLCFIPQPQMYRLKTPVYGVLLAVGILDNIIKYLQMILKRTERQLPITGNKYQRSIRIQPPTVVDVKSPMVCTALTA